MTLHEQDIVNNMPIAELLQNINARVFCLHEEIRRLKKKTPKWHDLQKNPDDLPPIKEDCKYVSIKVLTDEGKIVFYSYKVNCWLDFNLNEIPPFKAWCEIPEYTEE